MIFQEPMTSSNPSITIGNQISEAIHLHENLGEEPTLDKAYRCCIKSASLPRSPLQRIPPPDFAAACGSGS